MSMVVILSLLGFLVVFLIVTVMAATPVPEGQVVAVYAFGDLQGVVGPGVHFFPPFVTQTYPIDTSSMEILTNDGPKPVPPEFERQVSTYAQYF